MHNGKGVIISPNQTVKTNSFVIKNSGRAPATKLELVFNWKPMCLNLWPVRHHEEFIELDGRYTLIFDSLAPSEVLGIEVLSINFDLPNLITVRSKECMAQEVMMSPQKIVSTRTKIFERTLIVLGATSAIYLGINVVQFIILKTPN
jgi:hypothetical protein